MTVYNENAVPILFLGPEQKIGLSEAGHKAVEKAGGAARKAIEEARDEKELTAAQDEHLLLGEAVVVHNSNPGDPRPNAAFSIGASTLDEALKEVIAAFDGAHLAPAEQSSDHLYPPDWVASTHKELAKHLADYYSCEVRDIAEVI